jgi:ADP-ribose pyrophosphatase YjhB (NUDIX family)
MMKELHHIQKSIILSLAKQSPLRFSELLPPRIPNNTFTYHLKQLASFGYIESTKDGYIPTRKALKLVAFSANGDKQIKNPTILSMLYVTNSLGEVLLLNRNNRPYQGWYSLPSGLIHHGESLGDAAKRELFEKTTIEASSEIKPAGVIDFRYKEKETGDIFIHAIAFVYHYVYDGDREKLNDLQIKYGQLSWSKLGRKNILPEVYTVKELVESGSNQIISVDYVEPSHMPVLVY